MEIENTLTIDNTILVQYLKVKESPFVPIIENVYDSVKDLLNTGVQIVFPNYTLHNIGHSVRVADYMGTLVDDYEKLDELEITLLVCAALLHDVGMAVSKEDIDSIKSDTFEYCDIKFSAMMKFTNGDEALALQEYVRRIHATLSAKFINTTLKPILTIPKLSTLDFTKELALICESHTNDYDWIKTKLNTYDIKGDYHFNAQYIACILRLADSLDIDSNRTPYNLYKLIAPKGYSDKEWKQHFIISNNEKIIFNENTKQKKIVFHGKATDASTHRKLLNYIGGVKKELNDAISLANTMPVQYKLIYDPNPEVNIQTEGYTFSDYKMTLEFKAISSLLMGEKIYGDQSLGLRELIQNSIDSCKLRKEIEDNKHEFGEDRYQPKIKVILDKEKDCVLVKDNALGMSLDIIKKHFLNIGVSYYNSSDFQLKDYNYKPIGNYGIGFMSCFMLSNNVKVETRYYESRNKYTIELEKGDEWVSLTEQEDVTFEGTEVILNYTNFMAVFESKVKNVENFLSDYFLTDGIDFELIDKNDRQIIKIENPISLTEIPPNLVKIDISDYCKEFRGYILIKKKNDFIRLFSDLGFDNDNLYKYDTINRLEKVDDLSILSIDDFLDVSTIRYLSIPIIDASSRKDFLNGMKFTGDDVSEVISKLEDELEWIEIVVPHKYQSALSAKILEVEDYVFDDLNFSDLVSLGHSSDCQTEIFVNTINIYEGEKNRVYLPFKNNNDFPFKFSFGLFKEKGKELYIRNVYIKDFYYNIPYTATIFDIQSIVVNIDSRKFIPDISRNNVDYKTRSRINYMIGKAIHKGALDKLTLQPDEVNTLKNFISNYYATKDELEK